MKFNIFSFILWAFIQDFSNWTWNGVPFKISGFYNIAISDLYNILYLSHTAFVYYCWGPWNLIIRLGGRFFFFIEKRAFFFVLFLFFSILLKSSEPQVIFDILFEKKFTFFFSILLRFFIRAPQVIFSDPSLIDKVSFFFYQIASNFT